MTYDQEEKLLDIFDKSIKAERELAAAKILGNFTKAKRVEGKITALNEKLFRLMDKMRTEK